MNSSAEPRRRLAPLLVVVLAVFTDMLLYTVVIPVLPIYATTLGVSATFTSVLFASYSLALLLVTPIVSQISDRVGRRLPMLLGLVGLALSTAVFAFATDFFQLVLARALQGVAAGITWSAGLALLADAYEAVDRGWAMGVSMSAVSAGSLLGPPLGGFLYERAGYEAPFLAMLVLVAIDGVARVCLIDTSPRPPAASIPMSRLLQDPTARSIAIIIALASGGLGLLEPTLPLFLSQRLGASASIVGLIFAGSTLAYALTAPLSGWLVIRWGSMRCMLTGTLALAGALMLIGYAESLPSQAIIAIMIGVSSGLAMTPSLTGLAAVADRTFGGAYGIAFGLFTTAYAVGLIGGPLLGGALTDALGFTTAMLAAGGLTAGLCLLAVLTRPR
jgi:DHA1 family solute carrier family 18 vesicular amine transporter 1/2